MDILCPICSDLVNQADNIYVTKCGHIFHFNCLSQWIGRSKTCPQCRRKVTDRCMFRLYPTISNENTGDDAATLQSRLDDAQLQLRQQQATFKEQTDQLTKIQADLKKNVELLKKTEIKLDSRDSAVTALKEQLLYLKAQNNETEKLKDENQNLKKSIQTLSGLQRVLNATTGEVEDMLKGYSDIKTVAVFATALKRALCDSENKKNESRDMLHRLKTQLTNESSEAAKTIKELIVYKDKYLALRKHCQHWSRKRRAEELVAGGHRQSKVPRTTAAADESTTAAGNNLDDAIIIDDDDVITVEDDDISTNTVNKTQHGTSPYLQLRQSSLTLAALQNLSQAEPDKHRTPSEMGILNFAKTAVMVTSDAANKLSIFHKKPLSTISQSQEKEASLSEMKISYDGLGGHSKEERFPVPNTRSAKSCVPKLSAKHKLKRPPGGNNDISKMLTKSSK